MLACPERNLLSLVISLRWHGFKIHTKLPAQISKNIEISLGPGPVMQEDPKSANFKSLGGLVPEIWSKNRFLTIFDPKMGLFKNSVKFE